MDYGSCGIQMDKRDMKKLLRIINDMENLLSGIRMDRLEKNVCGRIVS